MPHRGLLPLAAILAACSPDATPDVTSEFPVVPTESGSHELAFLHDGVRRPFIVHIPASYEPTIAVPLLIVLHGGGGSARAMFGAHPLAEYSEATGYIFVAAQGSPQAGGGNEWNGSRAFDTGTDDVGYLERVILGLSDALAIDDERRWLAGFSGGATMSVRFASERSELVAAIATFAGKVGRADGTTPPFQFPPEPASPLSVQMTYGTEDPNLLGEVQGGSLSTSAAQGMQWWADALGCRSTPDRTVENQLAFDTYPSCASAAIVRMITVDGMGHVYPDAEDGLDGTQLLLDFFEDKVKPAT